MRSWLFGVALACGLATTAGARPPRAQPRWRTLPEVPALPRPDSEDAVEVGRARLYFAVYGAANAGKAPPVVLLHGGLGSSAHFGFQVPALVAKYEVITIDSRGQGRSSMGAAAITYDMMATDVIAVLDKLAVPRASIVGWSDGGEIALKLGIAFPDRVDHLFVFAANYSADGSKSRSGPNPTFTGYYQRCKREYEALSSDGVPYQALVEALRPLWHNPTGITRDQLRAIKAPVVMADGDHDEVIEMAQIKEMAGLIPHGQLKVFANASHFALWQDPAGFNQAILDFLAPRP
ncbi:MAG TPA: alpha/beta hydrolase [Kofleriaceae bacterium]|nr:alpha/beta hydrolase [Kofleriaceae bacterium]